MKVPPFVTDWWTVSNTCSKACAGPKINFVLTAPNARPDVKEGRHYKLLHLGWQIQTNLFCCLSLCCWERCVTGRNMACMLQSCNPSQLHCHRHIRRQLCCHVAYRMCNTLEVSMRSCQCICGTCAPAVSQVATASHPPSRCQASRPKRPLSLLAAAAPALQSPGTRSRRAPPGASRHPDAPRCGP